MQRYVEQLIEDIERVAKNPPTPAYTEAPPGFEDKPDIVELALVKFKPLSEWTGIDLMYFPDLIKLTGTQMQMINKAIFKLFESMNIELVDVPDDIPPEILYGILRGSWDTPVQYLPTSGFDLELCTGEEKTCPYGEYCEYCFGDFSDYEHDLLMEKNIANNLNDDFDDEILPF